MLIMLSLFNQNMLHVELLKILIICDENLFYFLFYQNWKLLYKKYKELLNLTF